MATKPKKFDPSRIEWSERNGYAVGRAKQKFYVRLPPPSPPWFSRVPVLRWIFPPDPCPAPRFFVATDYGTIWREICMITGNLYDASYGDWERLCTIFDTEEFHAGQ